MSDPLMLAFEALAMRFHGVDLCRRYPAGCGWPHAWRAQVVKSERAEDRITVYAPSMRGAVAELLGAVAATAKPIPPEGH